MSNITISKSRQREFEDLLMDYQRAHHRGQFGVSVAFGPARDDLAGNVTYFTLPDQIVLPILEAKGIAYTID